MGLKEIIFMNKVNDDGKILGEIYNCDGVAIVYRRDISGESFYPEKEQSKYIDGVELDDN